MAWGNLQNFVFWNWNSFIEFLSLNIHEDTTDSKHISALHFFLITLFTFSQFVSWDDVIKNPKQRLFSSKFVSR